MAEFLEEDCSAYLAGTRVEPAPNSEYAPISEMRLITRDYGILGLVFLGQYRHVAALCRSFCTCSISAIGTSSMTIK